MTDNNEGITFTGADEGQSVNESQQEATQEIQQQDSATTQQVQETPNFVTMDALRQEFQSFQEKFSDEVNRQIQSQTDKSRNNLRKRVEELVGRFEGIDEAPEQVRAQVETQAWQQALNEQLESDQPEGKAAQPTPEQIADYQIINMERSKLVEKYGIEITPEDPEAQEIVQGEGGYAFLRSFEAAQLKKGHRTGQIERESTTSHAGFAPGFVGGGKSSPSNPIQDVNDLSLLWEQHKQGGS